VIVLAKFGEIWTCFDPPIVKSWIEPRAKTEFLRWVGFFLSPVEPALPMIQPVFNWGFRPRFLVAPVLYSLRASDQTALPLGLLFCSFNRRIEFH